MIGGPPVTCHPFGSSPWAIGQSDMTSGHNVGVRFEVSRVLDAIERRLSIDPAVAVGVADLTEVMRLGDLDGGRPANLLRLGLIVDALGQRLGDGGAAVYAVADRSLISDTELTSNERMVIRRWSDDGLIEVLPAGTPVLPRVREISALTGLAMLTRVGGASPAYAPVPAPGGIALAPHAGQPPVANARTNPVLARLWRCPEPDCPSYGAQRPGGQPPPSLRGGAPICPRHGARLTDAGPRPLAWPMSVRVDGLVRQRWAVSTARPVIVGRAPDDKTGITLGPYLDEGGVRWISRNHLTLELRDDVMTVTDSSTNGTTILTRTGPGATPKTVKIKSGQSHALGEWDVIKLYEGVEVGRADRLPDRAPAASPDSVMADAPTMAMRLPNL
jgi:FHA domain-containing protein